MGREISPELLAKAASKLHRVHLHLDVLGMNAAYEIALSVLMTAFGVELPIDEQIRLVREADLLHPSHAALVE